MKVALVNGEPARSVALDDRGLHYGDGLFETLTVRAGAPVLLAPHLQRLERGCRALRLPAPAREVCERELRAAAESLRDGVLKLILTRGSAGRGYRPPPQAQPTRIVLGYEAPVHPQEWRSHGVRVRLCTTRLGHNPALAGIKHLNRLEQVLARAEWDDPEIAEGLMLDDDGHVICATSANVFAVLGRALVTPPVTECGVAGVMRGVVMQVAREAGISVAERALIPAELAEADEILLSNSVIGVWRVRELAGRELSGDAVRPRLLPGLAARGMSVEG
jgi:4-amino-4-deoxychorismate lyase